MLDKASEVAARAISWAAWTKMRRCADDVHCGVRPRTASCIVPPAHPVCIIQIDVSFNFISRNPQWHLSPCQYISVIREYE